MLRRAAGNSPGATVAVTLYTHATPVPNAMRLNMLRLRFFTEAQPRTRKGQPAHRTTGVPNNICTQFDACWLRRLCRSMRCPPISSTTTGTLSASPIQNRRLMSLSSALGPVISVATTGSSAIPQIGQLPGPIWRT
jgi:hypothetical protein